MLSGPTLALALHAATNGACLPYDGEHSLRGRLERQAFAGPPNFEDINKGDQKEVYWLLRLDQPICVEDSPKNADGSKLGARDDALVQLVLAPSDYRRYRRLMGREIIAAGTFFSAISGRHHTPILLWRPQLRSAD